MLKKISIDFILNILKSDFPKFTIDPDNSKLPYVIAGDFSRYLLACFNKSNQSELQKGLDFIEKLYLSDNEEIKGLATIGFLEAIQNTWINNKADPEKIYEKLGNESKKHWNKLNKFWGKKTKV